MSLAALSLFAVLCFRYPELLTTPDLRDVYPVDTLRVLLFAALLIAMGAALLSLLQSERRTLGVTGLALCALAIGLGGAWVETEQTIVSRRYLGLDWFVLDLLLLAVVFVPLERMFALRREQRVLRPGFRTDLVYFFVSHVGVQGIVLLTLTPAAVAMSWAVDARFQQAVAAQPLPLQLLEAVGLADLFQYGIHRLFHRVPWLWRFHAIHHSSEQLDWLAGSRLHLVDVVVTRAVSFVPLFVMGFSEAAMVAYVVLISFHAVWLHANLRFRFPGLRWVVATPEFHHWHHTAEADALDRNFAVQLPLIDVVFGTALLTDRWPRSYGTPSSPVPRGWHSQLVAPFRHRPR